MVITICRLAADDADRGDLKILNTALKELRYAFKVFGPYAEFPKVSIFGSARTPEDHPQYIEAKKFAELIQRQGWMVVTGAGDGIMRAGHHGASRQSSFGVAISLPFEQAPNPYITEELNFEFHYFFMRKLWFVQLACATVVFPGGFGTLDEMAELLTLIQTGRSQPMPVILYGSQFWDEVMDFEALARWGVISAADLELFHRADTPQAAFDYLQRELEPLVAAKRR